MYLHLTFGQNAGFIGRVGRLKRDHIALAAKAFERGLIAFDQGHNDVTILGAVAFFDRSRAR